jgi:hypothetical protein
MSFSLVTWMNFEVCDRSQCRAFCLSLVFLTCFVPIGIFATEEGISESFLEASSHVSDASCVASTHSTATPHFATTPFEDGRMRLPLPKTAVLSQAVTYDGKCQG